jgi:hypothetical protein
MNINIHTNDIIKVAVLKSDTDNINAKINKINKKYLLTQEEAYLCAF